MDKFNNIILDCVRYELDPSSVSKEQLKNAGADLVVSTYIELIDLINNLDTW